MKRTILIAAGVLLAVLGVCYSLFWGQAIREAGMLFSENQAQSEEAVRVRLPCFVRAVEILGVDIFEPAAGESARSADELATKISRGMYTHFALGAAVVCAGIAVVVIGLLKR
jgi:hypothetical protein